MKCRAAKSQFSAYMEADLSEAARIRVAGHLEKCERCARELEAVKKTVTLLRWIPQIEAEPDFTAQVMQRVRVAEERPTLASRLHGWWEGLALELPWRGFELPMPALASAGSVGLVAGVLMTLRLVGVGVPVAENGAVANELASTPAVQTMQSSGNSAVTPVVAGGQGSRGRWIGPSMPAYSGARQQSPTYPTQSVAYGGSRSMPSVPFAGSGNRGGGQISVEWLDGLAGPVSVREVEYVIRHVVIQSRQVGEQQVPDWVRVESGDLVTF